MYKINLFSRFFSICPPSYVGTHAHARCGSQLDRTRKHTQEREREGEKGMWRSLVVKVNCWSPGRHPLCRIFFCSHNLEYNTTRDIVKSISVYVLLTMCKKNGIFLASGLFYLFSVLSSNKRTKQQWSQVYTHRTNF